MRQTLVLLSFPVRRNSGTTKSNTASIYVTKMEGYLSSPTANGSMHETFQFHKQRAGSWSQGLMKRHCHRQPRHCCGHRPNRVHHCPTSSPNLLHSSVFEPPAAVGSIPILWKNPPHACPKNQLLSTPNSVFRLDDSMRHSATDQMTNKQCRQEIKGRRFLSSCCWCMNDQTSCHDNEINVSEQALTEDGLLRPLTNDVLRGDLD